MDSTGMGLLWRIQLWFLRHFLLFRLTECDSERFAKFVKEHNDEVTRMREKTNSDSNLIDSLNRYIATLEAKAAYQADLLKDLKRQLKELLAKPKDRERKNLPA